MGTLTQRFRVLPDTLIVGAQRSGTSSLFRYLARHPGVLTGLDKEPHYFNRETPPKGGVGWYRAHFPTEWTVRMKGALRGARPRVLEGTPRYLYIGSSHARMHALLPGARLVVLLRDPVERCHSQYRMVRERPWFTWSFEECIEEGLAQAPSGRADAHFFETAPSQPADVLLRGLYAGQLESLFRFYPREQVLVLRAEDFFADPGAGFQRVLRFLDLPPLHLDAYAVRNARAGSPMPDGVRRRLEAFYRPHNEHLQELLGPTFAW